MNCPTAEVTLVHNEARPFIYSAMIANHAQILLEEENLLCQARISCSVGQYCVNDKSTRLNLTLRSSFPVHIVASSWNQ
jgi:hypothetical protein